MKKIKSSFEQLSIFLHLLKWSAYALPLAVLVGSLVALFLWLLDKVTTMREQHEWLLFLLPVAGVLIFFLYKYAGKNAEAGNNLIMDEIHEPGGGVPARMTPLVLITTLITHLFGGSAGREGTAVQMGGSMAGLLGKWMRLNRSDLRILLMAGMAAGFGAVFGTPLTGAIFALEVLAVGRINHTALLPCFIAAFLADITCSAWGIRHTHYAIAPLQAAAAHLLPYLHFNGILLMKVILAGICFGLAGFFFCRTVSQHQKVQYAIYQNALAGPFSRRVYHYSADIGAGYFRLPGIRRYECTYKWREHCVFFPARWCRLYQLVLETAVHRNYHWHWF